MRFDGKTAVVTGAGSGIGQATIQAFADAGASVIVADINADAAEATAQAIRDSGGTAKAARVDVTQYDSVHSLMRLAVDTFGTLDAVFNNAGIMSGSLVEKTPEAEWQAMLDVNLNGVFNGCKAAIPIMRAQGGGAIVNSGSISAFVGFPEYASYAASKGAVVAFTRAVALEVGPDRIRVNAICPGTTATAMQLSVLEGIHGRPQRENETAEEYRAPLAAGNPIGRVAEPREIASAVLFLASDAASFVTGTTLVADGGFIAA